MPLYGVLDVASRRSSLPAVSTLARESWHSEDTEVLNFVYEIDDREALALIPRALHPTIPLYGNLMLARHAASPVGPFALAELRIICRAGMHQGGFTLGGFCDSEPATAFLRDHYGWPLEPGEVSIQRKHFAVLGRVAAGGRPVFEGWLEKAESISPADLLYPVSLHLALVDGEPRLVQAEPQYGPDRAERGIARVQRLDAAAFGEARVAFTNALPATWIRGAFEMRPVRWVMDPDRPAVVGAVRVLEKAAFSGSLPS
jgi:hypothetical protein